MPTPAEHRARLEALDKSKVINGSVDISIKGRIRVYDDKYCSIVPDNVCPFYWGSYDYKTDTFCCELFDKRIKRDNDSAYSLLTFRCKECIKEVNTNL